jgi:hypothetical protein
VQVAALQAIVVLQPLPPVQEHPEEQQGQSGLDQTSQAGPPLPTPPDSLAGSGASVGTRMPVNNIKKKCAPRCHLWGDCGSQVRSISSCNAIAL